MQRKLPCHVSIEAIIVSEACSLLCSFKSGGSSLQSGREAESGSKTLKCPRWLLRAGSSEWSCLPTLAAFPISWWPCWCIDPEPWPDWWNYTELWVLYSWTEIGHSGLFLYLPQCCRLRRKKIVSFTLLRLNKKEYNHHSRLLVIARIISLDVCWEKFDVLMRSFLRW